MKREHQRPDSLPSAPERREPLRTEPARPAASEASCQPLLIDAKAACAVLCMGERRLWVLSNCRAIPSFKIGKSRRYCPDELRAWVRAGCPTEPGAADRLRKARQP